MGRTTTPTVWMGSRWLPRLRRINRIRSRPVKSSSRIGSARRGTSRANLGRFRGRLRSSVLVRLHHCNIAQVTIKLIVVQAKPNHETVRYLETAELYRDLDQPPGIAVQERADSQRVGAAAGERLQKIAQRQPRVHNVLYQKHVFVFDAIVQILGDAHD